MLYVAGLIVAILGSLVFWAGLMWLIFRLIMEEGSVRRPLGILLAGFVVSFIGGYMLFGAAISNMTAALLP